MLYLAQVIIYTAAMLFIYLLLLRNKPMYALSRFYLLSCAILPALTPFIQLPQVMEQKMTTYQIYLPAIIVNASNKASNLSNTIPTIWFIYGLVTLLFITWRVWNLVWLYIIIRNSKKENMGTYTLIASSGYGPGSFGRFIFFPGIEVNETILAHERAHIRLHHTFDIILLNTMQAFLWPNVLLLLVRKELKQVHEFQADAAVNANRKDYTQLLLSSIFSTRKIPEMHLFIIHPIKRRIIMLQKNGTVSPAKATLLVCAAFILFPGVAITIQSCGKKTNGVTNTSKPANDGTSDPRAKHALSMPPANLGNGHPIPDSLGVYTSAQKMPEIGYDLSSFLTTNIHYPEYARKKGISGKVVVKFVVDESGKVKNPTCIKSVDPSLDNEALRVINMLPAFKPGEEDGKRVPVYFVLPIAFKL